WATTVGNPTTAGSGGRSRPDGSSAGPSPPTGLPTGSGSSSVAVADARTPPAAGGAHDGSGSARAGGSSARGRRRARRATSGRRLFAFDRRLGARLVAGAEEAGRGSLAGPVVAAAVMFDYEAIGTREMRALRALNDSKQHTCEARDELFPLVLRSAARVAVVSRCVRGIDERGLHKTNLAALRDALLLATRGVAGEILCLVDGFAVGKLEHPQRAIVDGDASSAAIAAASIV